MTTAMVGSASSLLYGCQVDLALHDESQQYGNLDETAAIARLPRNCLVLWLGDHRQTPGGLRKSTWTGDDWRPILGTSVDTRILPFPHFPCYCFGCSYEELLDYIDANCKV